MARLLEEFLNDFGYLAAMVRNLESVRASWAEYPKAIELKPNQHNWGSKFESSFRTGVDRLQQRTPSFMYGMCLVHACGLFEHFMGDSVREIIANNPRVLLTGKGKKKIDFELVINNISSPNQILSEIVDKEILDLTYQSLLGFIESLRDKFGLKNIDRQFDGQVEVVGLTRNCIVHNRSYATERLSNATNNFYHEGQLIRVDDNMVSRAITVLGIVAKSIDKEMTDVHFKNNQT